MKQVIQNFRSGVLKIDDVPPPMLRDGGLLVMNHVSLISPGTEKSTVQVAQKSLLGKAMERPEMVKKVLTAIQKDGLKDTLQRVFERLDTPAALGYSCAGTVAAVGADASQFSVGDRVACAGQNYASHAEVVYVPKNLCVKLPTTVDFEDAACVTLGAIALQGVRQAEPRLGDRIAVIGLGLLGQLTVQMLKAAGCRVLGSDLDGTKLDLARQLGADLTVRPSGLMDAATGFSEGHGVDAVIITASTKDNSPVEIAGAIARKKGRVVVVGAVGMNLPREPYYKKELDFKLSMSYGPGRYDSAYEEKGQDYPYSYVRWTENRNMAAFLDLVGDGKVQLKPLITHRFEISKADDAYRMMTEGQTPYMGMLITYPLDQQQALQPSITVVSDKPTGPLTLGLIGVGNHVKDMLLPQLQSQAAVSIRAVCTASGINAKALGEKLHAGYCTSDSQDVLRDPAINTVLIGTRHDTHGRLVVKALEADKHVFVEKPLCLTEEELDAIHAVYRDKAAKGLRLMVGFNRRFSPHAEKAREFFAHRENPLVMWYRINAGKIPAEHWIQDPSVGGGRLIGEACHFVDYMQSVCGARPNSVFARRIGRQSSGITDDQCIITLTFEDGSIGSIIYTAGGNSGLAKERFEAHADGKSLTMDDFEETHLYSGSHREVFKTSKRDKGFKTEIAHFVQTVEQGIPCVMSFGEIAAVTRACLLAVRSLQSGSAHDIAYV
ncbi:MAG: bi-domain-containing oxidoreductase [Nitrospira sp.]|nr:bi-domain-containing oxidoreductase [Nitrospira sp.]MBX3369671.1 bi-domain-containing oxidoreductase [Nitrospira sp.]